MSDVGYTRKNYKAIYQDMINVIFGKVNRATDANAGSVLSSLLEATARVVAEGYLYCKTGYTSYLQELPESAFGIKRIMGTKARGKLIFHCEEIEEDGNKVYRKTTGTIPIPKGIEVASGGIIFVTLEDGEIARGRGASEPILAEAKEIGEAGNVPANSITSIISAISNRITGVKNPQPFENGHSIETDIAMRKRFIHYLRGLQRTNKNGIIEAALKAQADHVHVVNYAPPKTISIKEVFESSESSINYEIRDWDNNQINNEENKKIYLANCIVYVCDKEGKCSSELLQNVRDKLRGKGTPDDPGYTPCGVQIAVLPIKIVHSFQGDGHKLVIKVTSILPDRDEASKQIKSRIVEFFQQFETGQSLVVSDLIVAVRTLEWITDVKISSQVNTGIELVPTAIQDGELLVVEKDDILVEFNI